MRSTIFLCYVSGVIINGGQELKVLKHVQNAKDMTGEKNDTE